MEEWQKRAIARDTATQQIPDWMKRAIERDSGAADIFEDAGPNPANIDDSEDAPALIRAAVGALDKPEDRLTAIRKSYPDAKPYGDDNFIYTDEKGKTRLYNQESWFPSLGDFASIGPEIGETVGGAGGGILGAILGAGTGAVGGTAVAPGPGTVGGAGYGGVLGAMTGAGIGSTAGREVTQRGLNYLFGNEDTRTGKEQLVDAAQTAALGAAGEGAGMLIGKGAKAGWNGIKKSIIGGGVMDAPEKIAGRIEDFRSIGFEPTPGMVTGSDRQATLEHAMKSTIPGQKIEARIKDAFAAQGNEFGRIVTDMSNGRAPMDKADIGEALRKQTEAAKEAGFARSNELYAKIPGDARAVVTNTSDFLKRMTDERAGMGQFDQLARGAQTDSVISQAKAIVADAQSESGWNLDKLKQARTYIGKAAQDEKDPVMQGNLNSLYSSLTDDLEKSAEAAGPEALQAFRKATNNFRRLVSEDRFGKGGVADQILNKDTDKIHDLIFNARKDGGNVIAAARRNIVRSEGGKEAWDDISGSLIQRLGMKTTEDGATFDPATFFRNWQETSFSDKAKTAVFKGSKNQQFRQDLDRLERIAGNMKRYGSHDNHSNTAKHQTVMDTINPFSRKNIYATALSSAFYTADPFGALVPLALRVAGKGVGRGYNTYQAKLLTSPATVNWLANVPKAEMERGGLKAHVKKLVGIAASTPDNALAAAINDYLRDARLTEE